MTGELWYNVGSILLKANCSRSVFLHLSATIRLSKRNVFIVSITLCSTLMWQWYLHRNKSVYLLFRSCWCLQRNNQWYFGNIWLPLHIWTWLSSEMCFCWKLLTSVHLPTNGGILVFWISFVGKNTWSFFCLLDRDSWVFHLHVVVVLYLLMKIYSNCIVSNVKF